MSGFDLYFAAYGNVTRIRSVEDIPAADLETLKRLGAAADQTGVLPKLGPEILSNFRTTIDGTTSVAVLSYQFFTGHGLRAEGLDYLLSPTGLNPNNLNSAYYQHFNVQNRFINFATNLATGGEAAADFRAEYGALSLSDAVVKAYTKIFGFAPDAAKTASLLNDQVPDGLGGTQSRAAYFAGYGQDGLDGNGTKAAMIGWLLAESVKGVQVLVGYHSYVTEYGPLQYANLGFEADLADGQARFFSDITVDYGPDSPYRAGGRLDPGSLGLVIDVGAGQSIGDYQSGYLVPGNSTTGNDTITSRIGLMAGQVIYAGAGNDTVNISGGPMLGSVFDGEGNDVLNVSVLSSGSVVLGAGYNILNIGSLGPLTFDSLGNVVRYPWLLGFTAGEDRVNFAPEMGPGAFLQADFSGATSINQVLPFVSAQTASNSNTVFQFEHEVWVYHQDGTPGVSAGDGLLWMRGGGNLTAPVPSVGVGAIQGDLHFL